jgi:hypothetical protein
MENPFVLFLIPVIICAFLGYLFNELIDGIVTGILIGLGFVTGMGINRKPAGKRKEK